MRCRTATPRPSWCSTCWTTAEACGADVIATECPTCHTGLEMHQVRAEKVLGRKTKVKILYFTQLLGMALGLSARKVGVHENFSDSVARFLQVEGAGMTARAAFRGHVRRGLDRLAGRGRRLSADPVALAERLLRDGRGGAGGLARGAGRGPDRRDGRRLPPAGPAPSGRRGAIRVSTPAARPAANWSITATWCAL